MDTSCCRCGTAPAFATLRLEAMVGETRLAVNGEGDENGICAACMLELAGFFDQADAISRTIPADEDPRISHGTMHLVRSLGPSG